MSRDGLIRHSFYYHELRPDVEDAWAARTKHRSLDVLGTQVVRKVELAHRVELRWRASGQPVQPTGELSCGIQFYERGWLMMQPLGDCNATIVKTSVTRVAFWSATAMRKYVENGRVVSSAGWTDITPSMLDPREAVVMQSYDRIEPELADLSAADDPDENFSALLDFVISATDARQNARAPMSFMDAPPRAVAPELSLEEALAFFDGYDDSQAHNIQSQSQQPQPQPPPPLLHMMNTDVLMMMDDGPAATPNSEDFNMDGAFLYGSAGAGRMDVGDDFGLMLQPLHLDDSGTLLAPTQPPAPHAQAAPMQALLAAPLAPEPEEPTPSPAARAPHRASARTQQPQRAKVSVLPSAATPAPAASRAGKAAPTAAATTSMMNGGSSSSSSLTKQASNSSSTKRVRRQKEELLYLRTKVVELEERLQQLRRVNGETNSARGSPAPSSSDEAASASPVRQPTDAASTAITATARKKRRGEPSSPVTDEDAPPTVGDALAAISPALLASVWENVAERQYKERLRAEQQNKKLKTMLESQIKLATSLEKILKKRPNMEVLYPDAPVGSAVVGAAPLALAAPSLSAAPSRALAAVPAAAITYAETDADVFRTQARVVVDAYPRAADVLAATGFFGPDDTTQHDFRVKDFPDEDGVLMEFMAKSTVPFDVEIAGNALWRFLSDVSVKKHCYFEEIVSQTDTEVSRSFGVRVCEDGADMDVRGKHTIRKFVEKDRVVIVSTSLVHPIRLADAKVRGLRLDDVAWVVAEPAVSNPSGLTAIKACVHIRPWKTTLLPVAL
ncbi:hypothetical protein PybrP1_011597 [[Pythium] brassicae (nom. inval.)]|nr:hypothetical protein PybrP1_011597 [[Pythium] brassicae (nom. inval.)]